MEANGQLTAGQREEVNRQLALFSMGAQAIVPVKELEEKIIKSVASGTPLKVKLGLDPSAPDVHLGHTVVLNKLKQFQECGHTIQLIIGDFTGRIGDPTGKSQARQELSDEQVKQNAETYFRQFRKVLDMEKAELHYNSRWLSRLTLEDTIRLAGKITVARMLERDDFEKRIAEEKPVSLHEFLYPLMQGYDSVHLQSDIEIGGNDQYFNVLMGRHLQEQYGERKQAVILMPLLPGLDGKDKMSKSKNNYIGIDEDADNMYGKTMSLPDSLMPGYLELTAGLSREETERLLSGLSDGSIHPRDGKMLLARTIVSRYHGKEAALAAEQNFTSVFRKGGLPKHIPEISWHGPEDMLITDLIVQTGLLSSKSEAGRMILNGGVRLNGQKAASPSMMVKIESGLIIQAGKRKFLKIL